MLMTSFATMLLCFYVVRLQLVSTVNDTIHTLFQNLNTRVLWNWITLTEKHSFAILFDYYVLLIISGTSKKLRQKDSCTIEFLPILSECKIIDKRDKWAVLNHDSFAPVEDAYARQIMPWKRAFRCTDYMGSPGWLPQIETFTAAQLNPILRVNY